MHQSFTRTFLIALAVCALLVFVPYRAQAQDSATTGTLTGVVRDAAGAGIPGATIALRNLTTNQAGSGQRRDAQLHAASLDVSTSGNHIPIMR